MAAIIRHTHSANTPRWLPLVVILSALVALPLAVEALDAKAVYDDVQQRVADTASGETPVSDRARDAVASAQQQIEDLKKKVQREDPGLWKQVKDQVESGSDRVSEAYASATSGGKTRTAYQKGKDGAASASAYASDAAEELGQQAEAARRSAFGQQKSAWQKAKDLFGGSGLFVHAEAAPTPAGLFEDTKAYAASLGRTVADKAHGLYAAVIGSSSRASASETYYQALDKAHSTYDSAIKKAQSQYASAADGSSGAGKAAQQTYDDALAKAKSTRDSASQQAHQAWDKASRSTSGSTDSASKQLNSAIDSARSYRDKGYAKAQTAYDKAVKKADATQGDASKAYDSAISSAQQSYESALTQAQAAYDKATAASSSAGDSASSTYESVKDRASQAYDTSADTASKAYDSTAESLSNGYDAAADGASKAYDKSAELADEASKKLQSSFQDYSTWSEGALENAQKAVRDASEEVANFVNAKTSQPTSSTEKAYNKAKKDLDSNLAAAKARVTEALGLKTKEADSYWTRLSKQWDSASASAKKSLNSQWSGAQKSQSKLSSWLSEAEASLGELYQNAGTEAEQKWASLKKTSADAAGKVEL